jgi:hypothetical protein
MTEISLDRGIKRIVIKHGQRPWTGLRSRMGLGEGPAPHANQHTLESYHEDIAVLSCKSSGMISGDGDRQAHCDNALRQHQIFSGWLHTPVDAT